MIKRSLVNRLLSPTKQVYPCPGKFCISIETSPHWSNDVIIDTMASQITSLTIVCSTVYSGADQRKHQSCTSLAFVRGIHRGPVNSTHKWPVTRKRFSFDDVIKDNYRRNGPGNDLGPVRCQTDDDLVYRCITMEQVYDTTASGRCFSLLF